MKRFEAIFQIKNEDGVWRDWGRQTVSTPDDAMADIRLLERKEGRRFRAHVEDWSDKGPHDPNIYYGDWDKSQLSPAAQSTGIFKPVVY